MPTDLHELENITAETISYFQQHSGVRDTVKVAYLINDTLFPLQLADRWTIKLKLEENERDVRLIHLSRAFLNDTSGYQTLDLIELSEVSETEFLAVNQHQKLNGFKGVWNISKPVFDEKREHCILYTQFLCQDDCGSGEIVFLTYNVATQKWVVTETILVWVS